MVKTTEKLRTMASDVGKYQGMLQGLITQGLCQLLEPNVVIRCRQNDIQLVKVLINLETCITSYIFCINFYALQQAAADRDDMLLILQIWV